VNIDPLEYTPTPARFHTYSAWNERVNNDLAVGVSAKYLPLRTTGPLSSPLATLRKPDLPAYQILMSAANQSSPNWADPNPNPNSAGESTAFSQALNPATRTQQLQPHVGLGGGASAPSAHVLGETPHQHGYSDHHHFGQQPLQRPLDTVAPTTSLEQPGFAQGNPGPIASGSSTGTGGVAGPATAGGTGERTHYQWTGTLQWQNDMKVARTEVTATATKGNPCALSPIKPFSQLKKLTSIGPG
jgi:hypothetical protein